MPPNYQVSRGTYPPLDESVPLFMNPTQSSLSRTAGIRLLTNYPPVRLMTEINYSPPWLRRRRHYQLSIVLRRRLRRRRNQLILNIVPLPIIPFGSSAFFTTANFLIPSSPYIIIRYSCFSFPIPCSADTVPPLSTAI
ncbi:hypothetical protein BROC_00805 [Candidatus Brocadiaceae bacterium]|nr:hypothetical protein BROC_00805 [Candidatus Brocadiaceae bacterium]